MRILIDADGCPVVDATVDLARKYHVECLILCDTSHEIYRDGAMTFIVSKGADSVDFALVNMVQKGDIIITQDYGLAAMCLAKEGIALNQDGMLYTPDNIDALLAQRHFSAKARRAGGRTKGPQKRTEQQNQTFSTMLETLLKKTEQQP